MTAERAIMLVKKMTYFGEFCYLNSSCSRKYITSMFHAFVAKLSNKCFCCFPATMLVPIQMGTNMAFPSKSLLINLGKTSLQITKYSSHLNLGEGLCIFTSFHFPNSGLYLLNGFDFDFDLL